MRKIAVFTGTRAEYGLLYWLMKAIQADPDLALQVIVSGMHLSPQYGETWREIVADGFEMAATVDMMLSSDTPVGIVKSMGVGTIGFADAFARLKPDILVVLGDRFEALAAAQAALIMAIPIAHIHGGELTLGAYDNSIRHAITKMAALHFVSAEAYRSRVIQMGEEPARVFNVGAPGLEHVTRTERLSFHDLTQSLERPLQQPYFLVTYHPVTLANDSIELEFAAVLRVLDDYPTHHVLFTYPNADNGGHRIIRMIEPYCQAHPNRAFVVKSLGYVRYLSAVAHADAVLGNSSSGIIEVPAFGVPSINIGLRQQGRLAAASVLQADAGYESIANAMHQALTPAFREMCRHALNPYGDGQVAARILAVLKSADCSTLKYFYDWDVDHAPH